MKKSVCTYIKPSNDKRNQKKRKMTKKDKNGKKKYSVVVEDQKL